MRPVPAAVLTTVLLAGTTGGCATSEPELALPPPPGGLSPVYVQFAPRDTSVSAGDSLVMRLTLFAPGTATTAWSSSDTSVAGVDSTGRTAARRPGTTTIRVTATYTSFTAGDATSLTVR
ncbi:MAG: Ig-like domain-containing protein [Gemmatimonadales bacterium]